MREIATAVDWPCGVRTLFRERNLGCGFAVSGAIDWFFEHELEGIILEDDCLPDHSFFRFSEELLEHYRDDPAVMVISGGCCAPKHHEFRGSYFFSHHANLWGWATWKRAWQFNDRKIGLWPKLRNTNWLMQLGDGHRDFWKFWTQIFDAVHCGKPDVWSYQWSFSIWAQNGLTIVPAKNLVKNIGFGSDATHTTGDGGWLERLPLEAISFPLVHPAKMERDRVADRWVDLNVYGTDGESRYRSVLRKIPGLRRAVRKLRRFTSC